MRRRSQLQLASRSRSAILTFTLLMSGRTPISHEEVRMSQKAGAVKSAQQSEVRPHQLGQDVFKTILPDDVNWKPFPSFPPGVLLAVVVGQPSEPGPYTIRVKAPHGAKLMPHRHPEDRVYTVISGVFYIGLGDEFDASK